ncbi:MAG TPA: DUF72 domain-containing protein [Dehalococcoidia bacterium]|nr:DUF72 domain-containing protein [Dehalococcoidia bacterium]
MTEYRIGTQGWSYQDWVGPFYPAGTPSSDWLEVYAQRFDTVELDTTFYRAPSPALVRGWDAKTPDGFLFAAKLPRAITHDAMLENPADELHHFLRSVEPLGAKLGPILAQLPPQFHRDAQTFATLRGFIETLPEGFQFAVEFRHRSWLRPEVYDLLRERGVAFCMIDLFYMPKTYEVTAPFTYVRWLGERSKVEKVDHVQIDRRRELIDWAAVLKERVVDKVQRVYAYVNNHYSGHSPANVRQLHLLLNGELPPGSEPEQDD